MWIILAYTAVCLVFMLFIILLIADLIQPFGGPKRATRNPTSIRQSSNWVPKEPIRKIPSQTKTSSSQNRSKNDPGSIRRKLGRKGYR